MHLFFKGLDDRTAEVLGLTGQGEHTAAATASGSVVADAQAGSAIQGGNTTPAVPGTDGGNNSGLAPDSAAGAETLMPPIPQPDDWYGWVPWEDEADALNLQNLEFLYRFL